MDAEALARLMSRDNHGVLATTGPDGAPQAATVGFAVDRRLELVIDTLATTRKAANIQRDPRVAFVVTVGEETFQCEGKADILGPPASASPDHVALYLSVFGDGGRERQGWPGILYIRVTLDWIRHSDFRGEEPRISLWQRQTPS